VGLLEERIGNFFTLTCCLYHTGCPWNYFYRRFHVIAVICNIQLPLNYQIVCKPKGILLLCDWRVIMWMFVIVILWLVFVRCPLQILTELPVSLMEAFLSFLVTLSEF
jgi:hypothetical protein